ncbi:hypothetical protein CRUP_034829 [Coryphaenoides rupestris]|nr:hypothetical protein CRUP_034829 [Coryphaenoides rupestris]
MRIYKDVLTGDEMFTDVYKIKEICDGFFYEVEGSLVTRTDNIDDKLLGANKSAEEVGDDFDANSTSGVDIVLSSHLVEMSFDKRTFRPYIKDYFYAGESMDPSGAVGMLDYREDGITPFMLFIKDGLEVEKV